MATTLEWALQLPLKTAITGNQLNGLANNAFALGAGFGWNQNAAGNLGYLFARVQLTFKFQGVPTTNTGFSIWIIKSIDLGITTEDQGVAPPRPPDFTFLAHAYGGVGDTNAHIVSKDLLIPPGAIAFLLKNDGTGQALTANNVDNVLSLIPLSIQNV